MGRVELVREDDEPAQEGGVREDKVGVCLRVGGQAGCQEGVHERDEGRVGRARVDARAGPEIALLEDDEVEAGHDAEVGAAAAAERPVEVGVGGGRGGHDGPGGEDDFVLPDVVARPAARAGEVGDAAAEGEAADADSRAAPADDGEAERVERFRDIDPPVAGADGDGLAVRGEGDFGELAEVDGYPVATDVGAAFEGRVAAGFDGEGGVGAGEDLDGFGDVLGRLWCDEAGGGEGCLACRPVAVVGGVVRGGGEGYEVGEVLGEGFALGVLVGMDMRCRVACFLQYCHTYLLPQPGAPARGVHHVVLSLFTIW